MQISILSLILSHIFVVVVTIYIGTYFKLFLSSESNVFISRTTVPPFIGSKNASKVCRQRFSFINSLLLGDLYSFEWELVRSGVNFTVEKSKRYNNEWPVVYKTLVGIDKSVADVLNIINAKTFTSTIDKANPLFQSSTLLAEHDELYVFEKIYRPLAIYPSRKFSLVLRESTQRHSISIPHSNQNQSFLSIDDGKLYLAKHTPMIEISSIQLSEEFLDYINFVRTESQMRYVQGLQDTIMWLIPSPNSINSTILLTISQIDLGSDIPTWLASIILGASDAYMLKKLVGSLNDEEL